MTSKILSACGGIIRIKGLSYLPGSYHLLFAKNSNYRAPANKGINLAIGIGPSSHPFETILRGGRQISCRWNEHASELVANLDVLDEWSLSAAIGIAVSCLLAKSNGLLLHAAMVDYRGKAIALAGPSGAGKSTLVANSSFPCIHDDMCAVRKEKSGWFAYGVPTLQNNGTIGRISKLPLECVYLLRKGKRPVIQRSSIASMLPRLSDCVIAPLASVRRQVPNTVLELLSDGKVQELKFSKTTTLEKIL